MYVLLVSPIHVERHYVDAQKVVFICRKTAARYAIVRKTKSS